MVTLNPERFNPYYNLKPWPRKPRPGAFRISSWKWGGSVSLESVCRCMSVSSCTAFQDRVFLFVQPETMYACVHVGVLHGKMPQNEWLRTSTDKCTSIYVCSVRLCALCMFVCMCVSILECICIMYVHAFAYVRACLCGFVSYVCTFMHV